MLRLFPRLMLVAGIAITAAACMDDGNSAPRGYSQASGYNNPYNSGYSYGPQSTPGYNYNYGNQQSRYNQADGRRYTTVTVTNRGQNGYRDDTVQQQVVCGSQYNDGYRTRTAPQC